MTTTNSPSTLGASVDTFHYKPRGFWQDVWRRFLKDRLAIMGGLIFFGLCLISFSAPLVSQYITHYDPDKINLRVTYAAPSADHWFGTDEYGRDYFTRLVYAGRISMSIGVMYALVSLTVGVVVGLLAGFYGKLFDDILQAFINIVAALPLLPLLILIGSLIRLDWVMLVFVLAAFGWVGSSRQVRGLVLSIRQRDYVTAATTLGANDVRIMIKHILPNVFSIVLVILGFDISGAILTESSLSFLGYGVQPPTATWGNMLTNSLAYTTKAPWLVVFPGLAIALTVLSIYLFADGLRDVMDPRLRSR